jgi:hypothetical protein
MAISRMIRVGTTVSFLAWGQLFMATSARAQTAPEAPPAAPPPEAQPAPPPPLPGAPVPPDAAAPRLRQPMTAPQGPVVRLNSDSPAARLQVMQFKWTDVCRAPCGYTVDPRATYRIGGGTVRPSEEFSMPRPSGVVDIETHVGSKVKHGVGLGLIIGGVVSLAFGGLFLAAASNASNTDGFGNMTNTKTLLQADGVVCIVTGLITAAIGIPLASSSTSVDVR